MTKKRAISEQAKEQKREAILMAALEAFYNKGFVATRMEDIAKAAGLSKGALYLYFASKEAVFVALIQHIALPKVNSIEQGLSQAASVKSGLSQLFTMAPVLVRQSLLPKVIKVLIADAFAFPEVVEHYRHNIIAKALDALTALLQKGVATGEIQTPDPELTARLVVAPVIFSVIWTLIFENQQPDTQLDVSKLMKLHQNTLFKGLGLGEIW